MKLLKGRKLLKKQLQIESRQGKIFRKIRHFGSEFYRRKVFIFNLIVILATAGYGVKYYVDREETKDQELIEQDEVKKEGDRLRNIFFNSVFKEEMQEQRELEEAEARRQASLNVATEENNQPSDEQSSEDNESSEAEAEVEEITEAEQQIIDSSEVLEQIEGNNDQEFPVYKNKTYKYTLKYPPNWYLDKETKSDSWLAYLTSYDPASHDRSELPQSSRLEILVQNNVRNLSLEDWINEGYKYNGEPVSSKKIKVADIDAYRNVEERPYPAIVVTLIHNNNIFTLTFIGGDITDETNIKIFDFMLDSLNFE